MKRRLLAMGLALLLVLAMVPTVWATPTDDGPQQDNVPSDTTGSSTSDTAGKPEGGNDGESQIQREKGLPASIINGEEKQCESLKAAVAAAKTGDTIQLTENEVINIPDYADTDEDPRNEYGEQIVVGNSKKITLYLNGWIIENDNTHD